MKLDGYRTQFIRGVPVPLLSRRGKNLSRQSAATRKALAAGVLPGSILNRELVALDAKGHPDLNLLQKYRTSGAPIVFFAFDILAVAGCPAQSPKRTAEVSARCRADIRPGAHIRELPGRRGRDDRAGGTP